MSDSAGKRWYLRDRRERAFESGRRRGRDLARAVLAPTNGVDDPAKGSALWRLADEASALARSRRDTAPAELRGLLLGLIDHHLDSKRGCA